MIGPIVTVTVDRPMGSYHPEHPDIYYPINYGYIEGTMAADGEEEDAYVVVYSKLTDAEDMRECVEKMIAGADK